MHLPPLLLRWPRHGWSWRWCLSLLPLLAVLALLAALAGPGLAQSVGHQGFSYRDSYRNLLWFEKYGQPKHLIVQHLQLVSDGPDAQAASLGLTLVGASTRLALPLDETGRTSLPLQKRAYDENAQLQINTINQNSQNNPINQNSRDYRVQPRISIALRQDGLYPLAQLRAACEQVLAYQSWREPLPWRGKKCVGVRFVFAKNDEAARLDWRAADGSSRALPLQIGAAFGDERQPRLPVANVLFLQLAEGQIHSHRLPLAIAALLE